MGSDDFSAYLDKYELEIDPHFEELLSRHEKKPFSRFVTPENQIVANDAAIDLIEKLLRYVSHTIICIMFC